jgi:7,8-dihydroneopterin aldolase/epimerase/oxygenase
MTAAEALSVLPFSAPAPHADSETLDLIFIEGFEAETVIGIHGGELHAPQPLRIDLAAGVPRSAACDSDDIADALDYGEVRLALHALMQSHGVRLLEALAEMIAQMLLQDFGAHWVRVRVAKPRKFPDVDAVGVMIERRRTTRPAPREVPVLALIGRGMVPRG